MAWKVERALPIVAALTVVLVGGMATMAYRSTAELIQNSREVESSQRLLDALSQTVMAIQDAQRGQRGYIITGKDEFLIPYHDALRLFDGQVRRLEVLAPTIDQADRIDRLKQKAAENVVYLKETVRLRRERGLLAAAERVSQGEGRREMVEILALAEEIEHDERVRLARLVARHRESAARSEQMLYIFGLSSVALLLLTFSGLRKDISMRRRVEKELENSNAELAERLKEVEERKQEVLSLNEFADALLVCTSAEEAYAIMASTGERMFPGSGGMITIISASRDQAEVMQQWGDMRAENFEPTDCLAVRSGRFHFAGRGSTRQPCKHLAGREDPAVCIPLQAHGETLGTVSMILSVEQWQIFREKRVLFEAMAEQAAITLSNLRLRETLRQQSIRDPLTGLFNRRYLETTLERELRRSIRTGRPLGLMMLDVDHFKRFNDAHGHDAGDLLLAEAARTLQRSVRAEDVVCRYGGEEFSIILPDADLDAAERRATALLQAVRAMRPLRDGHEIGRVTISIGVACSPQHGTDPALLLRAADQALYAAKAAGRDRAERAGSGEMSATV